MLLQLLLGLLVELLSPLLGLQLLPVWMLLLLGLLLLSRLSLLQSRPPSSVFAVLASTHWLAAYCPACNCTHGGWCRRSRCARRICAFKKNQSGPHCKPGPFDKQFCVANTSMFTSYITFQSNHKEIFQSRQI